MTESLEQEIQALRSLFWSERDPDGRGFVPLADAYRRAGDVRQAMDLLSDGLARHPEFVPAHVVAARIYLEQGMMEEGEIAARKALDLDPENVYALDTLLRVLEERGRGEEAADVRQRLLAIDPGALDGDEPGGQGAEGPEGRGLEAEGVGPLEEAAIPAEPSADEGLIDISGLADFGLPEGEAAAEDEAADGVAEDDQEAPAFELSGITLSDESEGSDGSEASSDTFDVAAPAPDEADEEEGEAVEVSALAPEPEPEADVLDVAMLAPDEGGVEEDVVDVSALAPDAAVQDEAEVLDVAALAPESEADVLDIAALAPEPEADVLDIAALAPESEADVLDIAALAPESEADVLDVAALAPDEEPAAVSASFGGAASDDPDDADEPPEGWGGGRDPGAPIYTRTLAELYVKQGFTDRALEVLRQLQKSAPGDESLARRVEELEAGRGAAEEGASHAAPPRRLPGGAEAAALVHEAAEGEAEEEEVETLARDLAESGDRGHEVDTPFAWTEQEAEEAGDEHQPSIREYFRSLLRWRSREGS